MNVIRRPMLDELARVLETTQAAKLGFVLTNAELADEYANTRYYGYGTRQPTPEREPVTWR
jgi:hypothetical protein